TADAARIRELKAALKGSDELYLATDEDREGEAISWHLLEVLKPKVPVKRMVFHEITRSAIEHAVESARDIDYGRVDAQESRRNHARHRARRRRLRGLVGRDAAVLAEAEGTVHHVDAATGRWQPAATQLAAGDARRPGPLRAGLHHLHANRLDQPVGHRAVG